jgi:hypothetical protein
MEHMRRALQAFVAVRTNKDRDSEVQGWENNAELQPRPGLGGIADSRIWRAGAQGLPHETGGKSVGEPLYFSKWLAIFIEHRSAMSIIPVDRRRSDQPACGAVS